jgi:hypothetical protein
MLKIILHIFIVFVLSAGSAAGQTVVDPKDFPQETSPGQANFEFYSRKTGENRRATWDNVRKGMVPTIKTVTYIPSATGNPDRGAVVKDPNNDIWYISGTGAAQFIGGTSYSAGTGISISSGVITNTGDLSATNELQTLSLAGYTITLSNGGGSVTLPSYPSYTGGTGITVVGSTINNAGDLSATNEGALTVSPGTDSTALINSNTSGSVPITIKGRGIGVSEDGSTIILTGLVDTSDVIGPTDLSFAGTSSPITLQSSTGDSVVIAAGAGVGLGVSGANMTITNTGDLSNTNELQDLSLTGQALGISAGVGVTLPVVGVAAGTGIGVASSGGTVTVTNTGDLSSTNEAQTLTSGTNTVTLSTAGGAGGGTVTVDTDPTDDITGSGVSGQVAYWDATKSIKSNSGLNYSELTRRLGIGWPATPPQGHLYIRSGNSTIGRNVPIRLDKGISGDFGSVTFSQFYASGGAYGLHIGRDSINTAVTCLFQGSSNPRVGVFQESPAYTLDVNGDGRYTSVLRVDGSGATVATSIAGRNASNEITTVGLGSGFSISGGTLNYTATSSGQWLTSGNSLAGGGFLGSSNSWPVSIITNNVTRMFFQTDGRIGVGVTPQTMVDFDFDGKTGGVVLPNGTSAQRPNNSGVLIPRVLRAGTGSGTLTGLEMSNTPGSIVHNITSSSQPTITAGNAAGTGASTSTSGNELAYRATINVGTAPVANGVLFSRNFGFSLTHVPSITMSAGNSNAMPIPVQILPTVSGYTVSISGTLQASQTYIFNVIMKN